MSVHQTYVIACDGRDEHGDCRATFVTAPLVKRLACEARTVAALHGWVHALGDPVNPNGWRQSLDFCPVHWHLARK